MRFTVRRLHITLATRFDPIKPSSNRAPSLQDLLRTTADTIRQTGPKGIRRSVEATLASATLLQEYVSTGATDRPEVLLRKLFERLGATYIKLGQFIASSPSLFPASYVKEFQKCLGATDPVGFEIVRRRIREELGVPLESVFSSVDSTPIASASIAQVHSARLKSSGKEVVIKVLKPGVEDVLEADLSFLYIASKILEFLNPETSRLSISEIISDIRRTISEEVDFKKEAEHIQHFQNYLVASGFSSVAKAPFVYTQYSTKKILTMEKLNGVALIDLDAIRGITPAQPENVLIAALNTWFGSVMGAETFHADVHAGNLLVLEDGKVGFIDFGIVGRISPPTWRAMELLLVSIGKEDYTTMAKAMSTMGATSADVDIDALAADIQELFRQFNRLEVDALVSASPESVQMQAQLLADDNEINELLLKIVSTGESHGLRFPREFGLLLKQLLYFDRYVRILAPTLQIATDKRINLGKEQF